MEKTGDGMVRAGQEGERTTWEERDEARRQAPIILPKLTEPGGKNSMLHSCARWFQTFPGEHCDGGTTSWNRP